MISWFVVQYLALVKRARYFIVIVWIALVACSLDFMLQFTTDTTASLDPPADSPSLIATAKYQYVYALSAGGTAGYMWVQSANPSEPLTSQNNSLWNESWYVPLDRAISWWVVSGNLTNKSTPYSTFNFKPKPDEPQLKANYVWSSYFFSMESDFPGYITEQAMNKARTGLKVDVAMPAPAGSYESQQWFASLDRAIEELTVAYELQGRVKFTGFGVDAFGTAIAKATADDMVTMFMVVLPIAMVIFCVSLSSLRYLILLFTVLIANAVLSTGILDIIAKSGHEINSLSPGIVLAFGMSLTTDYTYFLMCKYRKQVRNLGEVRKEHSVPLLELVLSSAGRTIFTSSFVIMCCSFGLLFLPVNVYSSVGWCSLVCPMVAMAVSLNLIPAMLCIQPEFWMNGALPNCGNSETANQQDHADMHMSGFFAPLFVDVETSPPNEQEQLRLDNLLDFGGDAAPIILSAKNDKRSENPDEGTVLRSSRKEPRNGDGGENQNSGDEKQQHLTAGMLPAGRSSRLRSKRGSAISQRSQVSQALTAVSRVTRNNVALHNAVSRHYQIVDFITKFPTNYMIIFLVLALTAIPVAYAFSKNEVSNDVREFLPRGTQTYEAWEDYTTDFSAGEAFPYFWVIETPSDIPFPDPGPFDQGDTRMAAIVGGLANDFYLKFKDKYGFTQGNIKNALYDGPSYATHPQDLYPSMATWGHCLIVALQGGSPYCSYSLVLRKLFAPPKYQDEGIFVKSKVRLNGTYLWISTPFNPASPKGLEFYEDFLGWRKGAETKWQIVDSWMMGYGATTYDSIKYARETLPRVVAVTFVAVFAIVTLMFGSPVITIRCTLTVGLAVACSFGLVNIVYVSEALNWVGWTGVQGMGHVAWPIPFTIFLVSTGIAVNYALISTIRSLEFYWLGVPTAEAIKYGAADSGREITVAAVMMMVIFSGLLFSKLSAMAQMGLYLVMTAFVSGVLYRLFLTPPLMAVLGKWNWWRPWPLNQLTPFVLPSGAATTKGTFEGEDFTGAGFVDDTASTRPKFSPTTSERATTPGSNVELYREDPSGPVYRGSHIPKAGQTSNGYGTSNNDTIIDTKNLA